MSYPFLITHGDSVWTATLIATAAASILRSVLKARRRRPLGMTTDETNQWQGVQTLIGMVWLGLSLSAVAVGLALAGKLALHLAGDRPYEGRYHDRIGEFDAISIAAATPWHRDEALERLEWVGFELKRTCRTMLAHAQYEELAKTPKCRQGTWWWANAQLAEGLPCQAADTMNTAEKSTWDAHDHALAVFANLGCKRWAAAARSARVVTKATNALPWACVAAAAERRAGGADAPVIARDGCTPLRLATLAWATPGAAHAAVSEWLTPRQALFDLSIRRPKTSDEDLAVIAISAITAMQVAPELFTHVRALETLTDAFSDDLLDMFPVASNSFVRQREAAFASQAVAVGAESWSPVEWPKTLRIEWLSLAMVSDVIRGDFQRAGRRVETIRALALSMVEADAGPRPGSIEWHRRVADRLQALLDYRMGVVRPNAVDWFIERSAAAFEIRKGRIPWVSDAYGEHAEFDLVVRTMSGDPVPLGRMLRRRFTRAGYWIAAMAPRLRPAPADAVEFANTPRPGTYSRDPAVIARDAADRRDALRLLGREDLASRWGAIARRQWELAEDRDLAPFFAMLGTGSI